MELTKKTTILFTEKQFNTLKKIAFIQKTSIGELIRRACEHEYGILIEIEAEKAVEELAGLSLPVGPVEEMKQEIVSTKPDSAYGFH